MNEPSSSLLLLKNSDFSSPTLLFTNRNQTTAETLEATLTDNKNLEKQFNENYFNRLAVQKVTENETSLEDENVSVPTEQEKENIQIDQQHNNKNLGAGKNDSSSSNLRLNLIDEMDASSILLSQATTNKIMKKEDDEDDSELVSEEESTALKGNFIDVKNDDALNDEDLNKLDDSINDDVNLDETNGFFLNNKRKLSEIEIDTKLQENDETDQIASSKIQKTLVDDNNNNITEKTKMLVKQKRIQSTSSTFSSPLSSPASSLNSPPLSASSSSSSSSTKITTSSRLVSNQVNDNFTLTVTNKATNLNENCLTCECLLIDAVSENCYSLLKLTQTEIIEKKTIYSMVHPSDHGKFLSIFNMLNKFVLKNNDCNYSLNDAFFESYKPKPFTCQMFVNNQFDQNNNSTKQTNNLLNFKNSNRLFEKMIVIPTSISSSPNEKTQSIQFVIKQNKLSTTTNSNTKTTISSNTSISPNSTTTTPVLPSSPSSFLNTHSYDCNMDSFKTNMTRKGLILYAETNNLRNLFANSSSLLNSAKTSNGSNTGLLCDTKNGKLVNILDYVHSNDQNHINQHINNVCTKGENTSAIYRLKVSEKYAFVQTHSRLVPNNLENNNNSFLKLIAESASSTELYENDKHIICSTHSIIKEIDTEVEMKGNASTSLMKTLISKKPPPPPPPLCSNSASSKSHNNSSDLTTNNKANKSDSIKLKTQFSKEDSLQVKSESTTVNSSSPQLLNNREQTPAPIGTKFALTMLGLSGAPANSNTQRILDPSMIFQKNSLQQPNVDSSMSSNSNESNGSNLLFEDAIDYKVIKTESNSNTNDLNAPTSPQSKLLGVKKQIIDENDSMSPVASSFSKNISLNETNIKEESEQINIKKQKLFDTTTTNIAVNAGRKSNVLLKRLLSTNTRQDKSPDSSLFNMTSSLTNRSPSPMLSISGTGTDFQNEFDLSPILDDMKEGHGEDEDIDDEKNSNEINFSSPIISPMNTEQEKELKDALYLSLSNKNNFDKQSNKINTTNNNNQYKTSSTSKDDIILRTLLNTADLEPQILKLESVFDLNASFNNNKVNCAVKKEAFESQNQPPVSQLSNMKSNSKKLLTSSQQQMSNFNNASGTDQFSQQMSIIEKTRKRKKIAKSVIATEPNKTQLTPTIAKQTSKKLAAQTVKNNKQQQFIDYEYQQQPSLYNNNALMIKQEKIPVSSNTKKQISKSKGTTLSNNNKSLLKQILIDDEDDENDKKLLHNNNSDESIIQQFKIEQPTSPLSLSMPQAPMIMHQQQQQHQNLYSSYPINNSQQQYQLQQSQHHLNIDNNSLLLKMTNIKEEKIFTSSSLSSSTTSVSSISSLSSPISHNNNLVTINHNANNTLVSSLVNNGDMCNNGTVVNNSLDNMQQQQSQDYYLNNQQQHMFLNLTNDLLDDFHLTSKTNNNLPENENSQYVSTNVDNQFFMDTSNNSTAANRNNSFTQMNCNTLNLNQNNNANSNDDDDEMLNQLEQVFSIERTSLNEIDGDLDVSNNNFMASNILSNNNNNITSTDQSLFLSNNPTNNNNINLINKPHSTLVNNNSIKVSSNQMKTTSEQQPNKVISNAQNTNNIAENSQKMLSSSSTTSTTLKDDDLTKQKRIEAISKHLKTDLIESFKSSNISAKLSLLQSPKTVKNSNINESCFSFGDPSLHSSPASSFSNQIRNQMNYPQPQMMVMQQQQQANKNVQMNSYNSNNLQHSDDNNVPNLTIDPMNSFPFNGNHPQQQHHHHMNQHLNHMHMNGQPTPQPPPATPNMMTSAGHHPSSKSNRRMSLASANMTGPAVGNQLNLNQMQQLINDEANNGATGESDIQAQQKQRQNFAFNSSGGASGIDSAQTRKKLQERLQRNAANSISSQSSQMPNSTLISSQPSIITPTSSSSTMQQITVRTGHQIASDSSVLLTSPNNNSSQPTLTAPPPIYNNNLNSQQISRKIPSNNTNSENMFYQPTPNSNPNTQQLQQFKQNTNSNNGSPYLNQPIMNNMVPPPTLPSSTHSLQKQLSVTPVTSSPGSVGGAGQSPTQQSLSPSSLLQQPQQHVQHLHPNTANSGMQPNSSVPMLQSPSQASHLLNYNNNNSSNSNPSQQVFPSSNNSSNFINDNQQNSFISNNLDQQSQYQMFNNDDASFYSGTGLNDNEIILDDQMNRNSNSIRKQSTADFVKKQLGNTVNKRILQSNVKHQENMPFYGNNGTSNDIYLPASPSASNQIQQVSNLTVNTNNNMMFSNQKQNLTPIMSPPVLMLNGQQTSSNDQMNLINNNFASPSNLNYSTPSTNNLALSPQPPLISPTNNNSYMNPTHQKLQNPFNSQLPYQGQVPPEYSQTNNQYGKYIRPPPQHRLGTDPSSNQQMQQKFNGTNENRFMLDQNQSMPNINNNYLHQNINDEFDLNFIQSNDSNPNLNQSSNNNQIIEEVEQKQLVHLIQQQGNEVNSYQYQNQSVKQLNTKQNYQTVNNPPNFYRQQQFQQSNSYNNYHNNNSQQQMFSNQQIRIEQSSSIYQQPNNQSMINYNSNLSNDLSLMSDEPTGSLLQQLLLD